MNLLKKSLNDTFFYSLATAGSKLASFLIIPFLNSLLSVEKFGEYDLFLISSSFLIIIIGFGIDSGLAIIVAENKNNKNLLGFLFTKSLIISLIFLLFIGIFSFFISVYFNLYSPTIVLLLFLYVMFTYINYATFNFIRWVGNAKLASLINFLSSVLGIVIGVCFLYFFSRVIVNLFLGLVIGSFLGSLISIFIVKKYLVFKNINNGNSKVIELFKLSIPFVPVYLSNYFSAFADRFIIITLIGDIYFIGLYALLHRISQLGSFIITLISKGFLPVMYKNYNNFEGKQFNKKVFDLFIIFLIPVFIFILFTKNIFIDILGGNNSLEYLKYSFLLPSIFLSNIIFNGMALNGLGFTIKRKTIYITYISFFSLLINIAVCFLLVPVYGFSIIISSTLFSAIISASLYTIISEKLYKFNYNLKNMYLIYFFLFIISQIYIY